MHRYIQLCTKMNTYVQPWTATQKYNCTILALAAILLAMLSASSVAMLVCRVMLWKHEDVTEHGEKQDSDSVWPLLSQAMWFVCAQSALNFCNHFTALSQLPRRSLSAQRRLHPDMTWKDMLKLLHSKLPSSGKRRQATELSSLSEPATSWLGSHSYMQLPQSA